MKSKSGWTSILSTIFLFGGERGRGGAYLSENLIDSSTKGTGKCLTKQVKMAHY